MFCYHAFLALVGPLGPSALLTSMPDLLPNVTYRETWQLQEPQPK